MTQDGRSPEHSPYEVFEGQTRPAVETVRLPGEAIVEQAHAEHPEIEERPYQIDCLGALSGVRRRGEGRALIHMATGLGKTTVAALDVKDYLQANPSARVLFVSHQNEILRQARSRFEYVLGSGHSYGMFNGLERSNEDADCVFASFQLLRTQRDVFTPKEFDYIVVDESHHGKATTYEPSLLYFEPHFLLGMTATPDRRDLKEIRDIFGDEVYSKSLSEALEGRLLARPDYKVILDNVDESLLERHGATKAQLNKDIFIPKRDEEIVDIIQEKTSQAKNPKAIIFCPSIEHAERIAYLIPGAHSLHSGRTSQERRSLLNSFIHNGISTLTAVDVLNEGVDVADANIIVFLRSTQSRTIFQQQLGRGLRKTNNKDSVLVLDFVANCDRLAMIDEIFGRYAREPDDNPLDNFERTHGDASGVYAMDFSFDPAQHTPGYEEIDVASLEFSETSRKILEILRNIEQRRGYVNNIDQEAAIKYYNQLSSKIGRVALIDDIKAAYDDNLGPNRQQLLQTFNGSLRELREAAGLTDEKIRQESIRMYQAISERVGHPATSRDIKEHRREEELTYWQLITPFDRKLSALKEAAGFEVPRKRRTWQHWEQKDAVEYYQQLSDTLGHPATSSEIDRASKEDKGPSFITIGRFCEGSISNLRVMAGFEPSRKQWKGMNAEAALEYYKRICAAVGKVATVENVIEYSQENEGPSLGTLTHHFNRSIMDLQRSAGFEARQRGEDWDRDRVLAYYVDLTQELGRWPTRDDIAHKTKLRLGPNINLVLKHFDNKMARIREAANEFVILQH